ncbi:MAG: hypothetical protein ACFE8B_16930 [Candidatus Hermodarchaeota archaeon]
MVIIVTTSNVPYGKEKELAEKYLEVLKKYPLDRSLEKPILRLAARASKKGNKIISITEVKEGKYEELIKRIVKMNLAYSKVEGFYYKIETYLSGAEALPMIGLSMPED